MALITLSGFYKLMLSLRDVRINIIKTITQGNHVDVKDLKKLEEIKLELEDIPKNGEYFILEANDGQSISLELDYELSELKKDEIFLKYGHKALKDYMKEIHKNYDNEVNQGLEFLKPFNFKHFITDRDGTVSNYCGRYQSSVQPIYNALCLSEFRKSVTGTAVILTSAPLFDIGLADISVQPDNEYILAGSKGREILLNNQTHNYPIDEHQQQKLSELNDTIEELLKMKEYASFRYIGSGLQYKFGQTTLARQDKNASIPKKKSLKLKKKIEDILKKVDPKAQYFSLEDTGKDLEIMLNIESGKDKPEEFDKGHGLKFIIDHLNVNMDGEHVLICGDTASDVPLISAAKDLGAKVVTVFVTEDETLKESVKSTCADSFFVSSPDVLIYMLFKYSKNENSWNPLSLFI